MSSQVLQNLKDTVTASVQYVQSVYQAQKLELPTTDPRAYPTHADKHPRDFNSLLIAFEDMLLELA